MNAFIAGLIWSLMWILFVWMILMFFPWELLHDYPKDIQAASTLKEPTPQQKRTAKIVSGMVSLVIIGSLFFFGLLRFRCDRVSFQSILQYLFLIAMTWNVVDLVVMDWLIVCTITPGWIIIEGTEGCQGYHDYLFHFKGFLMGCLYTAIMAFIFAGLDYIVLLYLIWR